LVGGGVFNKKVKLRRIDYMRKIVLLCGVILALSLPVYRPRFLEH